MAMRTGGLVVALGLTACAARTQPLGAPAPVLAVAAPAPEQQRAPESAHSWPPAEAAQVRAVEPYRTARVDAALDVQVLGDGSLDPGHVVVRCDAATLPGVRTVVREGILLVGFGDGLRRPGCAVAVHADDLTGLTLAGDRGDATDVELRLLDHRVLAHLRADAPAVLRVVGPGRLTLSRVEAADVELASESGRIGAHHVRAGRLGVRLAGAARALLEGVDVGELALDLGDASRVSVDGTVGTARVAARGTAEVDAAPTVAHSAEIDASDASRVWLIVVHRAEVDARGRAVVGLPGEEEELVVRTAGDARVR